MQVFNASTVVEVQLTKFSCSVGATYWCLRSLGVQVTQADLQAIMVPTLVSPDDGLLDGSGATLAALLRDHFGIAAQNVQTATFDDVTARAGRQPILLGGHRWYRGEGVTIGHWVAARGYDGARISLANPAGPGPKFGQDALDRAAFDTHGPFSAVWVDAPGEAVAPAVVGRRFRIGNTDGQGANLRSEARVDADGVALREGTELIGDDHAWREVTDPAGQHGWMAETYLARDPNGWRVTGTGREGANLRPTPGVAGNPLDTLPDGTLLIGGEHAWRHVVEPTTGREGWLADEFLVPA